MAGLVVGDLAMLAAAHRLRSRSTVILHLATAPRNDAAVTRTLVAAADRLGRLHLVYVSIVGVDRVPLPYYREKLATERMVEDSGLPWTILRATRFQPVDVRDVAARA